MAIWIRKVPHRASPVLSVSKPAHRCPTPNLHWVGHVAAFTTLRTNERHTDLIMLQTSHLESRYRHRSRSRRPEIRDQHLDEIPVDWITKFDHHLQVFLDDDAKKKISFAADKSVPPCFLGGLLQGHYLGLEVFEPGFREIWRGEGTIKHFVGRA